jgi:hypothetical protein
MTAPREEAQLHQIVTEVISRLAVRLGADGSRGNLIMVFTGATVELNEASRQAGLLILEGFKVQMAFSESGERLFGPWLRSQLSCFPQVSTVSSSNWLSELSEACLVVVPLLSVNALSKVCFLIADNLALNLILQALFMGKPVVVARDGADPASPGRRRLGFHHGRATLSEAILERLKTLEAYGCTLTSIGRLNEVVRDLLSRPRYRATEEPGLGFPGGRKVLRHSGKTLTASDIVQASRMGADFKISSACLVTPLAFDLALQHQVALDREGG